jgi:hypothetical protein
VFWLHSDRGAKDLNFLACWDSTFALFFPWPSLSSNYTTCAHVSSRGVYYSGDFWSTGAWRQMAAKYRVTTSFWYVGRCSGISTCSNCDSLTIQWWSPASIIHYTMSVDIRCSSYRLHASLTSTLLRMVSFACFTLYQDFVIIWCDINEGVQNYKWTQTP